MHTLTYRPECGTELTTAIRHARALAKRQRARVQLPFNGVLLWVTPKKSPATILWEWTLANSRLMSRYHQSAAYQRQQTERAAEIARKQTLVTRLVAALPSVLACPERSWLMLWLDVFTYNADDMAVLFNHQALAVQLETAGYVVNQHVGAPKASFTNRRVVEQYILGQVLNCLHEGMPPHPITRKFIDQYFAQL